MDIENVLELLAVSRDYIKETIGRTRLNETISEYFALLFDESGESTHLSESQRVYECCRVWQCDRYSRAGIHDVTFISHCRSRFCLNCQKLIQASRLSRFSPLLMAAANDYDLYHVVFTVPNVPGIKLKAMVKLMSSAFRRLIRYLRGVVRIKGLSFQEYGFYGCLRSLEVTYSDTRSDFHPHYHCIFALKKNLEFPKTITNCFSYSNEYDSATGRYVKLFKRSFSEFEVLLQKLWRALIDSERDKIYSYVEITDKLGKPLPLWDKNYKRFIDKPKSKPGRSGFITLSLLTAMAEGYSVTMDLISSDAADSDREAELNYYEVFKYAFKVTSDESRLFDYAQFKTLYFALKGVRTMQGYGAWHGLKCDDVDNSVSEFYNVLISYLKQREFPVEVRMPIAEVLKLVEDNAGVFITRRSVQRFLNNSDPKEIAEYIATVPPRPEPLFSSTKRIHMTDISAAYYRYLDKKRTSPLFADIRAKALAAQQASAQDNAPALLVLTPEQMSFIDEVFGL